MEKLTRDDILRMIKGLKTFHDDLGNFFETSGLEPLEKSKAAIEVGNYPDRDFVKVTHAQGHILIEAAADHLIGFTKTVTEPVLTMAPWTCVRGILESAAIAAWLLDPNIEGETRVKRGFAFRFAGLDQQLKFGRVSADKPLIKSAQDRIDEVEQKSLKLGFKPIQNKQGKRDGIAMRMPSTKELIKKVLDEEASYRLLSSIAHAHPWALQQSSFQKIENGNNLYFEKNINPDAIRYLCVTAAKTFTKPVWFKSQLFGWKTNSLEAIIKAAFDSLGINSQIEK